jgi:hypothetical protein
VKEQKNFGGVGISFSEREDVKIVMTDVEILLSYCSAVVLLNA